MILRINEIFHSIQGETTSAGFPSLFIRLAGCNLECKYCDTAYARTESSGKEMTIDKIIQKADSCKNIDHITITGGEPLLQHNTIMLMKALIKKKYSLQLETNGSTSIKDVPKQVIKIVDVKTPSSGFSSSFLPENLQYMNSRDELKFVILDINDYNFSKEFINNHLKNKKIIINFSPVHEKLSGRELADLILIDKIPVRLNLQLHKIIWPDGEPKTKQE